MSNNDAIDNEDWKDLQQAKMAEAKQAAETRKLIWWRRVIVFWSTAVLGVALYGITLGFRSCAADAVADRRCKEAVATHMVGGQDTCSNGARMTTERTGDTVTVRCVCPHE